MDADRSRFGAAFFAPLFYSSTPPRLHSPRSLSSSVSANARINYTETCAGSIFRTGQDAGRAGNYYDGSEYDGVSAKVMAMATGFEMLTEQLKRQLMHEYPEVLTPGIWAFRDNAVVSVYRFRSTAVPASAACACWYMRVNTPMCLRNCPAQMIHDRRMKTLTFLVNDSPPVTVPNVSNHARSDPFCSSPFISLYPFAPLSLCPPFFFSDARNGRHITSFAWSPFCMNQRCKLEALL